MGQRAPAQPSEAEDHQLAVREAPVLGGKFGDRGVGCQLERRFRRARQRTGDGEGIGEPLDQLDAEREADLARHDADRIEQRLVILARGCALHARHDRLTLARQV